MRGAPGGGGRRFAALAWVASALSVASCSFERAIPAEIVHAEAPPTWFEDGWSYYEVSPDGSSALFGARFGFRLIDLESGRVERDRYVGSMDRVTKATFLRDGRLAWLGIRGGEEGWFTDGADTVVLWQIPLDANPRWSPDGSLVAYYGTAAGGLFAGSPDDPTRYDFDGFITGVAWAQGGGGEIVYVLVDHEDGVSLLARITLASHDVDTVMEGLDATARFSSIAVSPDGSRAYIALAGDRAPDPEDRHRPEAQRHMDIFELDLATRELRAVVQTPGDDFFPQLRDEYLYWTHNEQREDIVVVPVSGGDARVLVEDGQIPYWSADGSQVAFTVGGWGIANWALNLDVAVVNVDADAAPLSDPTPIVQGYHEDFTPARSPVGRWIAYHSHRSDGPVAFYAAEGGTDDIYLRRPDAPTEDEIRLTDFGWEVGVADWSPDSRRLVFDSWERGGAPGISKPWIATIDSESGRLVDLERLPLPPGVESSLLAAWSPLGDEIAMVARIEGRLQVLWILSLDGGRPRPERLLQFEASTYGGVDWTPDGQHLVYAALAGDRMQLFSVPRTRPNESRQLTSDGASLVQPQVSPDGRWIAATRLTRSKQLRRLVLR